MTTNRYRYGCGIVMPRTKNTRDTLIYWILDTRPEKMVKWPFGEPFYCGKTVARPNTRLSGHRRNALLWPGRETSKRILECGEHLTLKIMETVPIGSDWTTREKHWIKILRFSFDATNIADGGSGVPGYVQSAEAIAKTRAAKIGKPRSAETRAKLSAALKGRKLSPEMRAQRGNVSVETRAKIRAALKGRPPSANSYSAEARAKISASKKGKPRSPETIAKICETKRQRRADHILTHTPDSYISKSC